MSLTVKYLDTPEGAQEAAAVTCEGLQPFSDTASMVSGAEDVAWATTEPGLWALDGTGEILPDEPENIGWWSESRSQDEDKPFVLGKAVLGQTRLGSRVSILGYAFLGQMHLGEDGAGCKFEMPPIITINFSERFSATGITITFSPSTEQWCSEIKVRWYRDGELLTELHAFPDSPHWAGGEVVDSFDQIAIELLATNKPGQFARIQQIIAGQTIVFGRGEIISAQLVNEVDPTLGSLSVDTSRFEVLSPSGMALNPQENQRMELYRDARLLAAHYIESSSRETDKRYIFDCQSAVGMLEDDYLGGIYKEVPVDDVVSDILNGWRYEIADELRTAEITGYLPVCPRWEALQQVVFAIGAMVTTFGTDKIRLVPLPEVDEGEFAGSDIFLGAKLEASPRIARYEVTVHRYAESSAVENLLENEEIDGEDVLITFNDPHHGYEITGGTITGSGANWITVTASGAVTVTAKTYKHTTAVRTKKDPNATHVERSNVLCVTEATLVNNANGWQVLNRLYKSGQWRQTLTQEVAVSEQQVGMIVLSENPWGSRTRGIIASMDSTLTQNGHTANVTIVGTEAVGAEEEA